MFIGVILVIIGKVMFIGVILIIVIVLVVIIWVIVDNFSDVIKDVLSGFVNFFIWLIGIFIMILKGL